MKAPTDHTGLTKKLSKNMLVNIIRASKQDIAVDTELKDRHGYPLTVIVHKYDLLKQIEDNTHDLQKWDVVKGAEFLWIAKTE